MSSAAIRLVLTTCPNAELAQEIARALVNERLAACVNVLAGCRSVYAWQGKVCEDDEVPLLIKTTAARYPALEARLRELHPYELPEVIAVDLVDGLPAYLDWVAGQTAVA
jgi:periplasmic divalent cation tolerance protein